MNSPHRTVRDVDELLRKVLADDLPADVADGMRERIDLFRAKRMEDRETAGGSRTWFFRRTVWAALAILMLAAGILIQGAKSSSPLADRIASIKATGSSIEQIRR
jgi:hypothetical protein